MLVCDFYVERYRNFVQYRKLFTDHADYYYCGVFIGLKPSTECLSVQEGLPSIEISALWKEVTLSQPAPGDFVLKQTHSSISVFSAL